MQILDCTLRDGGYYTNWDFSEEIVDTYLEKIQKIPIDFIEVGYRNPANNAGYSGEYFHLSVDRLKYIKSKSHNANLAVMVDTKSILPTDVQPLFQPLLGIVDLIRLTVQPDKIRAAIPVTKELKKIGFQVAFNLMYMSKVTLSDEMLLEIKSIDDLDYLYLVDSYGGILPHEMIGKIEKCRAVTKAKIGFHGHNNMELALANTIEAIKGGIDIVDSTILGMGRGAGNLKTELFLTYLITKKHYAIDMNVVSDLVKIFTPLLQRYKWGTNYPYMLAGASNLPQKTVMEWLGTNRYSVNSIIRGILSLGKASPTISKFSGNNYGEFKNILIIGGGPSVGAYLDHITRFLSGTEHTLIIHSSSRYLDNFKTFNSNAILCLSGSEADKLKKGNAGSLDNLKAFVLPPAPRKMGTVLTSEIESKAVEIDATIFPQEFEDSPLSIALSIANECEASQVYLIGFDGYQNANHNETHLREENQGILDIYIQQGKHKLVALTKTHYKNIEKGSLFSKTMLL